MLEQSKLLEIIVSHGEIPERSKGTDCKSVGSAFAGSNPALATTSTPTATSGFAIFSKERLRVNWAALARCVDVSEEAEATRRRRRTGL